MDQPILLADIERAWGARDPSLARLICHLVELRIPDQPKRKEALTWDRAQNKHRGWQFKKLNSEERREVRVADWTAVEAADAEVPLPDRLRLHGPILALWEDGSPWARDQLLEVIASVDLKLGPWRALKRIFKEAEAAKDREIFGALAARFDTALASGRTGDVSTGTLNYLVRRAWRSLRHIGVHLPASYPDYAGDVLRFYPDNCRMPKTWIANHILFHEQGGYTRTKFKRANWRKRPIPLQHRAFADAWRRSPRPLFTLLERAQSENIRAFAVGSLRTDFRTQLREVEPEWVGRLIGVHSQSVDTFVVWLLDEVPKFEPGAFRELGLHDAVLMLLDSDAKAAASWAASYARTHARDLPLDRLIRLANGDHDTVRRLARDLLRDRHPRDEVGLDAWGRLLGTYYGHDLAATALREHFGASELTLAWFEARLLCGDRQVVDFASKLLPKIHPKKKVPATFWQDILDHPRVDSVAAQVALNALEAAGIDKIDADVLRRAWLAPHSSRHIRSWLRGGRLSPTVLGAPFLKAVAFHPTWEADPWIAALKASDREWAQELTFDESSSEQALSMLAEARTFKSDELGFEWLFEMVQRAEPRYHAFAVETLTRAFHPSHFTDPDDAPQEAAEASPEDADLQGMSFLFTGKLATMTRGEAQKMVKAANGKKASGVNAKLDFLVIGDEGSPLYGGGRKGSKQVKAEKLRDKGADLRIISETAFLQMLAGESVEVDEDAALAGCERLWKLATEPGPPDAPLRSFALHYLRMHHADYHLAETDRPLDPGAELPDVFLTFDRARDLCADSRTEHRSLGLLWLNWELAKWAPPMAEIVALCELPHAEVRDFVELALTADESRRHRRYRLDPAVLTPEAVYRFCESLDAATRGLGMRLIALHPRLAIPEELFRLTESPDRQVRGFVVRQLWGLYRDKGGSSTWTAPVREDEDPTPTKPDNWPAEQEDIRSFLRRTLFGIPPARMPKGTGGKKKLRPLPARKVKLALIDVCRDLALEDRDFAERLTPLFQEFLASRGPAESAACLVALTRIAHVFPGLGGLPTEVSP